MKRRQKIKVHSMDDWFSGIYMKPFNAELIRPAYDSSLPHRHDFYYCVLMDKGSMGLTVDFKNIQLTDHSLFLSYPGQIHQIDTAHMDKGWFLAFDPLLLDEQLKIVLDQCLSEVILVGLSVEQSVNLSILIHQLYLVYKNSDHLFRQAITQSMVTALVYQLAAAYLSDEQRTLQKHSLRSIEITKSFKQILRQQFREIHSPAAFAALMNTTVSHLNDTVKAVTGFTLTQNIQQEIIREAKRLLYYSEMTVKEIADSLSFEDEKYFSRLFSKATGMSPTAFRSDSEMLTRVDKAL